MKNFRKLHPAAGAQVDDYVELKKTTACRGSPGSRSQFKDKRFINARE
jgi:hypothetical protein